MRYFAITLAGAGVRAAGVEVAEVLEEVMLAVAIASPFPQKERTRVRANLDLCFADHLLSRRRQFRARNSRAASACARPLQGV